MTRWEMPHEPDLGTVWTRDSDGAAVEWTRDLHIPFPWRRAVDQDVVGVPWNELVLRHGPVYDRHPDLDGWPGMPWTANGYMIRDVNGYTVAEVYHDDVPSEVRRSIAALLVQMANEYGRARGGTP